MSALSVWPAASKASAIRASRKVATWLDGLRGDPRYAGLVEVLGAG
jgi:hypothetical protein